MELLLFSTPFVSSSSFSFFMSFIFFPVGAGPTSTSGLIVSDFAFCALRRRKKKQPMARIKILDPIEALTPAPMSTALWAVECELNPAPTGPMAVAEELAEVTGCDIADARE